MEQKSVHGGDIYTNPCRVDFSANINPFGMPESVKKAAQDAVLLCAGYPDVQCRELRAAIAEKELADPEMIICGNGAAELIFQVVMAEKPRKALLVSPGFAEYEQALRAFGCEIQYYELSEEQGFHPGMDYLDYLTDDVAMIFLCNPNNPTGVVWERDLLFQIIDRCAKKHIRMVLDLCFAEFLSTSDHVDVRTFLKKNPQLFVLKAFTKTYAMAGLRLGYGICMDENLLGKMRKMSQPWNVSIPAQKAGTAALQEADFVKKTTACIRKERTEMQEKMRHMGLKVYDSRANFIFFQGPENLEERCRKEQILIRDCSNYHGLKKGYFRVAVRTHEDNLELLHLLEKILTEQGKNLPMEG